MIIDEVFQWDLWGNKKEHFFCFLFFSTLARIGPVLARVASLYRFDIHQPFFSSQVAPRQTDYIIEKIWPRP